MFQALYPDVGIPKTAWQWVESAQYRLLRAGAHRALSCVDLLVCACAVSRGLVILHDDNDFVAAARHLPDLAERLVHELPG
jgi:predicted nucleic acid-binding protein